MKLILFLLAAIFMAACSPKQEPETLDRDQPYIERQPIHYKYAPKNEYPLSQNDDGSYRLEIEAASDEMVTLHYLGETYPLHISPGQPLDVYINRGWFPLRTKVAGPSAELNEIYQEFLPEEQALRQKIRDELPGFRENEQNEVLKTHKELIALNKRYFEDTGFEDFIYKAKGEYLVRALDEIQIKRGHAGYDAEVARQAVLDEAVEMDFFTLKSLKAQRAGIRDFTHSFSQTFGIKEELNAEYGMDLQEYDVRRLGYEQLNEARVSVLDYIEDKEAYVHAQMYLVAERIGEAPFEKAEPTYFEFIENYPEYTEYAEFLTDHYNGMKAVQPGQPAIEFSVEDYTGEVHTMADYRGKYVLLDLWASWCIPCLQEFPHMERLYEKYDRDDFEIVALSIEEDREAWENAVQRYDHPWPQLHDGAGFQQETFTAYRGGGIPFYILINREGKIERHNDIRASFNLEEVMDSLLSGE
ncbi:MAG: TlpA disulfide reductase family protein [Balneolales bacterium]